MDTAVPEGTTDIVLDYKDWSQVVGNIPAWSIVPATEEFPPFFWYRGIRVHQKVNNDEEKVFYPEKNIFE